MIIPINICKFPNSPHEISVIKENISQLDSSYQSNMGKASVTELFSPVKSLLKSKDLTYDNFVFKLFYKISVALCLTASLLVMADTYIGDPIKW